MLAVFTLCSIDSVDLNCRFLGPKSLMFAELLLPSVAVNPEASTLNQALSTGAKGSVFWAGSL